ncbi:MAG: SusD/RagB family nutrient-binding outer membrane lipoprotein [Bacteroidales bacterium]
MKIIYVLPALFALLISISSCDKDFEQINTNPILPVDLDPVYQFSSAELGSAIGSYPYQGEIVQQIITPYGGVLEGGNRNTVNDANSSSGYNSLYQGPIKNLTDVISKLKDNPDRINLYSMARIMKAYCFQLLVDTYGDVPYSEAAKGFLESKFFPKYDDQKVIYLDLLKEYEEATDALTAGKDVVSGDVFYKGDITKWKKLGNSLLLRAGMRYTKIDEVKAKLTVAKAVDPGRGGVMASNADNTFIQANSTFNNGTGSMLNGGERANYYIGKPYLDFLKNNNDPRILYIAVLYKIPANPLATAGAANTNPADQIGMPYGYDETSILSAPGFPGTIGGAFKYSMYNRATVASILGREYLVTYSQTQLLLAEARQRGYITTSTTKDYYEAGIKGHMTQTDNLYGVSLNITPAQQDAYLLEPEVAFVPARALEQINEQYWVVSCFNWQESWANFRRSGYPQLSPINYPGEDPAVDAPGAGGFIHRLQYPFREKTVNTVNVNEAATRMGGDNMGVRIFWDKL